MTVPERIKRVTELKLCKICLRKHESKNAMLNFALNAQKRITQYTLLHQSGGRNTVIEDSTAFNQQLQMHRQVKLLKHQHHQANMRR